MPLCTAADSPHPTSNKKTGTLRPGFNDLLAGTCLLFCTPLVAYGKLVTAFFTAAGQYFAAIGGLHALTETMRGFTAALGRLVCTFLCHLIGFSFFKQYRGEAGG